MDDNMTGGDPIGKEEHSLSLDSPATKSGATSTGQKSKKKSVLQKKKSATQSIFSLSSLSTLAAIFYVYIAFSNFLNMMYPLRKIPEEVLKNMPEDKMVFPFWGSEDSFVGGDAKLGLRVYLSSEPDFSLDYFSQNDQFAVDAGEVENVKEDGDDEHSVIREGKSFLLWSEDDALEATQLFPSRSFVIVATDDPSTISSCFVGSGKITDQSCSGNDQQQQQTHDSVEFAYKWLQNSIEHEKQLQSDGGGLMAAMNSAGGGIESTSVLLTLYTSLHRNIKHVFGSMSSFLSNDGDKSSRDASNKNSEQKFQKLAQDKEEPSNIIYISPKNSLWKSLMSNGTAYVHVLLVRQTPSQASNRPQLLSSSPNPRSAAMLLQQFHSQHNVLFGRVGMMKQELPLHVPSPKRLLYRDLLFVLQRYTVCPLCRLLNIKNSVFCGSSSNADDETCIDLVAPWNFTHHQPQTEREYRLARQHKKAGITYPYFKPEVMIHLIQEKEPYPLDNANQVGFDIVRVRPSSSGTGKVGSSHLSGYAYLPAVHVDEIGLTSDKYIPLNETVSALPLRIGFHSGISGSQNTQNKAGGNEEDVIPQQGITPARYRLLSHLSRSLESQSEMGFEQSDIDDLRRLIAETNVMLLAITILASVLHLLFEFLTFKSDVDFWRGNTDLTGLSVRALFLDWMSQVVILLYLIEMDSSLLMTIPTGVGMLIALWKCQRGAGLKFVRSSSDVTQKKSWYNVLFGFFGYELSATRLRAAASSAKKSPKASKSDSDSSTSVNSPSTMPDLAALTEEMDQLATRLLGRYFLLPLVTTYALYSLLREPHAGWYSWFITTASSFVYAVGFVLMTPQLFLNYKLKSVAHLPWRVLGYRFVNTFIDDLFAFIIRMPTMARMSCFRDDVVFVIYLWQRYLYPVDTSRPVEGGGVGDVVVVPAELEQKPKKGKKKKA